MKVSRSGNATFAKEGRDALPEDFCNLVQCQQPAVCDVYHWDLFHSLEGFERTFRAFSVDSSVFL